MATTSRTRRHWQREDGRHHHVIDPRTGDSAWSGVASVTVVTADAWWAEVLAKAAFIAGITEGAAMLEDLDVPGLIVEDDQTAHAVAGMQAWLV